MSEHDQDPPPPGPALAPDGTVTGRPRPAPSLEPTPAAEEAPLELQARPRAVKELPLETFRDPPPPPGRSTRRSTGLAIVVVAVALAVGFFGASMLVERRAAEGGGPPTVRPSTDLEGFLAGKRLPVVVDSEPPGAVVQIGADVVGVTPWAGDNRWGEAEVNVRKKGYQPWKGRLSKDAESRLNATLQPAAP